MASFLFDESGAQMISSTEQKILQGWLLCLTVFEIPNLHQFLVKNGPLNGFYSTLKNSGPEKRVYSLVLMFLCVARLQALIYTNSPGVLANNAVVHILEAIFFGIEKFKFNSNGSDGIFAIIVANAAYFLSCALRA